MAATVTYQITALSLSSILGNRILRTVVSDGCHEVARIQGPLACGLSVGMQSLANEVLAFLGYI